MVVQSEDIVSNPKVSVIIVTYNQKQYIKDAVISAINQQCVFPFEIIVADDCSRDGTKDILIDLQKSYPHQIRLLLNEQNLMVVKNCFNAIMEARGEFIAMLGGDDFWIDNNKLSKQVEILDNKKDVSIVHTGYQKLYEETDQIKQVNVWNSPLKFDYGEKALRYVLEENFSFFPMGSSILFRSQAIKDYRYQAENLIDNPNAPGEGMLFFTHFAMHGKFYFMKDICVTYRIRKDSLSHIVDKRKQVDLSIKYAFQKINIADYYHLKGCIIKFVIKLILLYLYSVNTATDSLFVEELSLLGVGENSKSIKKAMFVIRTLSKFEFIRNLLLKVLLIRNKRLHISYE